LEERFGREAFDAFLRGYFDHFAFQSIPTARFVDYAREHLLERYPGKVTMAELEEWLYEPGIPANAPQVQSRNFGVVDSARLAWLGSGTLPPQVITGEWSTQEWVHFLEGMPQTLSIEQLSQLDTAYRFTGTPNGELAQRWYPLAIRSGYVQAYPAIAEFVRTIGRRKLIMPTYEALVATATGLQFAREQLEAARPGYHPITTTSVERVIAQANPAPGSGVPLAPAAFEPAAPQPAEEPAPAPAVPAADGDRTRAAPTGRGTPTPRSADEPPPTQSRPRRGPRRPVRRGRGPAGRVPGPRRPRRGPGAGAAGRRRGRRPRGRGRLRRRLRGRELGAGGRPGRRAAGALARHRGRRAHPPAARGGPRQGQRRPRGGAPGGAVVLRRGAGGAWPPALGLDLFPRGRGQRRQRREAGAPDLPRPPRVGPQQLPGDAGRGLRLLRCLSRAGDGRRRRAQADGGEPSEDRRGDRDVHRRRAGAVAHDRRRAPGQGRVPGEGRRHAHRGVRSGRAGPRPAAGLGLSPPGPARPPRVRARSRTAAGTGPRTPRSRSAGSGCPGARP